MGKMGEGFMIRRKLVKCVRRIVGVIIVKSVTWVKWVRNDTKLKKARTILRVRSSE